MLEQYGFSSLSDCLLHEITCADISAENRANQYLRSGFSAVMIASLKHPNMPVTAFPALIPVYLKHAGISSRRIWTSEPELRECMLDGVCEIIGDEMDTLVTRPEMRRPLKSFDHEYISSFSMESLADVQRRVAPVCKRLIDKMVIPPRADSRAEGVDEDVESSEPSGRKRDLISTSALCVATYGRSQRANSLAGMVGYYLSACNTGKRAIANLNALGVCVSYESVIVALRSTAVSVREMVRKMCTTTPFFISFDNMVFYQRVKTATMQNRAHIRNYTAGYVCFLQGARNRSSGLLPRAEMLDWTGAVKVTNEDLMISAATFEYTRKAAAANIWKVFNRYFREEMGVGLRKRDYAGNIIKGFYDSIKAPAVFVLPNKKSDLHTLTAFAKDESIITEVIEIIKLIVEELDLPEAELLEKMILFKGDYMTVRNLLWVSLSTQISPQSIFYEPIYSRFFSKAVYRRQEDDPINQMQFVEPVIGLFHAQMCLLGTIFKAHWGNEDGRDPATIKRFINMMGKSGMVSPKIKDFRAYDNFFNDLLDGYIIALGANMCNVGSVEDLARALKETDWERLIADMVDRIYPPGGGLTLVRSLRKDTTSGEALPDAQRDALFENYILLLSQGLPYRDFSAAVKAGDPGRIEHILSFWTSQLHGTRNINYPREFIHVMSCIRKIWSPELLDLWRRNSLVNPTGRAGGWMCDDLFGEYVVREIKAKIHESSNLASDSHLRLIIACQVMSLFAAKRSMMRECRTKSSAHSTKMDSASDVKHIATALIGEGIPVLTLGRMKDEVRDKGFWQAIDLIGDGVAKLATGIPLSKYKAQARYTWYSTSGGVAEDEDEEDEDRADFGEDATLDDLL